MGNEQRFQAESNLIQALVHLIKRAARPAHDAARHWQKDVAAFLLNARRRYRPSMRRAIDLQSLWLDACRLAHADLTADDHAVPQLPRECPVDLAMLIDPDASAAGLRERIGQALAA